MPTVPPCPFCGTTGPRRLIYGLVIGDVLDDPDVALGGCVVGPDAPRWRCRNAACAAEYGRLSSRW